MITDLDTNKAYFSMRLKESEKYADFAEELEGILGNRIAWLKDSHCDFWRKSQSKKQKITE